MPTFFRKRPGSKNFKANVTQKGLSSFTLTNAAKKGELRVNYNTKRGFSLSIPGTGLSWRSKSYANYRQSAAQKRGYDLRTKEGKAKEKQNKAFSHFFGNLLSTLVASVAVFYFTKDKWAGWSVLIGLLAVLPFLGKSENSLKETNDEPKMDKGFKFIFITWGSLLFAWYYQTIWGGVVVFSALALLTAPVLTVVNWDENTEPKLKRISPFECYVIGLMLGLPLWYFFSLTFEELILSIFAIGSIMLMIAGGRFGLLWTLLNSAIFISVSIIYTDLSPQAFLANYADKILSVF